MKIETAARNGDVATLQELYSNGVDVTGVVSEVVYNHWIRLVNWTGELDIGLRFFPFSKSLGNWL